MLLFIIIIIFLYVSNFKWKWFHFIKKRLNIEFLKENDSQLSEFEVLEQVY